jgi:hypothetical protein
MKKYLRKYKLQDVVGKLYKERVYAHINELSEAQPGTSDWLKFYPSAVAQVTKELTEEELAECEESRDEWNKAGPIKEEQQK